MKKCLALVLMLLVFVQVYAKIPVRGFASANPVDSSPTSDVDAWPSSVSSTMAVDTDSDGVDDGTDQDDDNDGILDTAEAVGGNNPMGDADGDGTLNYLDVTNGAGSGDGSQTDYTDSDNNGIPDVYDVDGDGIANHLDLDSDNDGIPDNIEAQTTLGYVVPNADNAATYLANDGLNSAYTLSGGYSREGLLPVDTDGDAPENRPDYLDTNSDNEGEIDTKEAGFVVASSSSDVDHDGLLDAYERGTPNDGYVPNDGITNPSVIFTDSDSDVNSGGDVNYRDDINDSPGIMCGPVSTLYQTVGNSSTGKAEVYRYNPFLQQYLKVGELEGASNSSASNSAYNAVTQYVYSNDGGGQTLRVYNPADDFAFVGEITITGTSQNFNNVLFAQRDSLGFINGGKIIKFDVSGIVSYPATVNVTEIAVMGTTSTPADYALLGNYIYGIAGASPTLIKVNVNTGAASQITLALANNTTDNTAPGSGYGAAWQDRFGNFYSFNNNNGDIYKITDVKNATTGTTFTKILLAAPSNQNDGFGCELNPDPLDWDGDTVSDDIDLDDDNDGILDTVEDKNLDNDNDPLTNFTDTDGDNIPDGYDLDSDGDGIPDNVEAQTTAGYIAPSNSYTDGLDDAYPYPGGLTPINTDAAFPNPDAIPDYLDVDSDNDGVYDAVEANLVLSGRDYDGDGLDNNIDTVVGLDDPNGIINDPSALPNSDGINDIDARDAKDSDGDGIQDVSDADDDNDGIPDTQEVSGGYDPLGDADGDGAPNFADVSQGVGSGDGSLTDYTDSDNNGIPDVYDVDGDGIVNHLDLDSDNDGIYDAMEAGHGQAQTGGRVSGSVGADGLPDAVQNTDGGLINYTLADSESTPDGTADFLESDADGDGCNDVREAGFTDDDDNGFPGTGTFAAGLLVNTRGVVTSGSDGYTAPNANYTDATVKIACNRAPTSANKTLSASEDTPLVVSTADLGYSDPDADALSKITINTVPALGTLFLDANANGIVDAGEALSDSDEVTKAQLDAGQLKYVSATNGNGTGYATFTFTVNDSFTDAASSSTITFNVTAVNDAPTAANKTLTTNEDVALTVATTDLGYADVDNDALDKITINQISAVGTLFLDADDDGIIDAGEALSNMDEVSKADLDANRLKFLPASNASGAGYASFRFTVNDGTADAATFSTITLNVNAVNDAPGSSNNTVTTNEDTDKVFAATDFPFSDVDAGASLDHIKITGLPTHGTLFVDTDVDGEVDGGETVTLNQTVASADIPKLTFKPEDNANGTGYDSFNFQVNDGTDYATASSSMTINVTSVNDAPAAADKTLTASEDTPLVIVTADLGYSDVESDALSKITIDAIPLAGTLFIDLDEDGEVDGGEALADNDPVSKVQLDAGKLKFLADANDYGTTYASFDFIVNDGTLDAASANTATFNVTAINDAPQASDKTLTGDEDLAIVIATADLGYSDPENDPLAKVIITSTSTVGTLFLDADNDGIIDAGEALSNTDEVSKADLDAGLLKFLSASNGSGIGYDSFGFKVDDGSVSSAASNTITFDISAVNDEPTAVDKTLTVNEDTPLAVSVADLGYSDIESNALNKIIVEAIPTSGTLYLDLNSNNTIDAGEVLVNTDEVTKLQLDAGLLKFLPDTDENGAGYAGFEFKVHDGTAYSSSAYTITFDVTAVNDAPTAANKTLTTNEDVVLTVATTDLGYADVDNDALDKITINQIPAVGTLFLDADDDGIIDAGEALSNTDEVSKADLDANRLKFLPASNASGAGYASFRFTVNDGTAAAATFSTITLNVTAVNDAPTAANESVTTDEDADYIFSAGDFSADYGDIENDVFDGIKITGLATVGSLTLDGVDISLNDEISLADFTDGDLVFTPAANQNGLAYATFKFQVKDAVGAFSTEYTLTIHVTAVGDAPLSADKTITTDEDTNYEFKDADFSFSDASDGDNFVSVIISSLPAQGTLYYNGVEVIRSDVTSETAFADRTLFSFTAEENAYGTSHASFGFKVVDDAGDVSALHTITVDVNAVNDAPTLSTVNKPAAQAKVTNFSAADFTDQFSDVEGDVLTKIQIVSLPANGTLLLNGVEVTINDEIALADLANLTFTPNPSFTGTTSFVWKAFDGTAYSASAAQVSLNVVPQQTPVLTNIPKAGDEDETFVFTATDFTDNFSDGDGDPLTKIQITALPAHGTLYLNGVAVSINDEIVAADLDLFTFVPDADFNGSTSFSWKAHDGFQYSDVDAQVELTVSAIQDKPVLSEVPKTGKEDEDITFAATDFTAQFSDADGETLAKIQIISLPENGTLLLNGVAVAVNDEITAAQLNQLVFSPDENYSGTTSFSWKGSDGTDYAENTATVSIEVEAVADGIPVASPATFEIDEAGTISNGSLTAYVTDPEGNGISFSTEPVVAPVHGTLVLHNDGTFTYTPQAGYVGEDSFTYEVCDHSMSAQCVSGTVKISIGEESPVDKDSDQDGISDVLEIGNDPAHPLDSDGDGTPDFQDTDSDNDGISDAVEVYGNPTNPLDTDGDNIPDYRDTDSDGDGISDHTEAGTDPSHALDSDGDGIPNYLETDSDNDGIPDAVEVGDDPTQPRDSDGDGIPDFQDADSDNDGIPDAIESGSNPDQPLDTDGDGIADYQDTDSDGDGLSDSFEAGANPDQPVDTDKDGIPDMREVDSDNDGVPDATEVGSDPNHPRDLDGDGIPDFQETDSDGDGIADSEEDVIVIYKGFSPNNDGKNELWMIDGIEDYPNNTVQIFNRWGNKVYEVKGYNNQDRAWSSESSLGLVLGDSHVPDGTYFYIIDLGNGEKPRKGYITVHR